jgi:ribosomal protein S18 acetylase RimI-like enzyme
MEIQIEKTSDFSLLAKLNESVQSLHQQLYPEDFKPFDFEKVTKAFERMLSTQGTYAYLAKIGSIPIGYILCFLKTRNENEFQHAKTVLYIDQISVDEAYRNQGVAKLLVAEVTKLAKHLKIDEIQLDHWSKNEDAKRFFSANGFEYFNSRMKKKI